MWQDGKIVRPFVIDREGGSVEAITPLTPHAAEEPGANKKPATSGGSASVISLLGAAPSTSEEDLTSRDPLDPPKVPVLLSGVTRAGRGSAGGCPVSIGIVGSE